MRTIRTPPAIMLKDLDFPPFDGPPVLVFHLQDGTTLEVPAEGTVLHELKAVLNFLDTA